MLNLRMLKLSDGWLWVAVGALILIGFLAIFSCTHSMQIKFSLDPFLFIKRQLIALLIGLIGLSVFAYFDYKHLKQASPFLYFLMLVLLAFILFGGASSRGAQRWFQLGPFSFQPSEISKVIIIINLSVFLFKRKYIMNLKEIGMLLAMVGAPFFLIFKQPDLGTALVFFFILIGLLAVSGSSPKLLVFLATPLISVMLRPVIGLWIVYLLIIALVLFLTRATFWDWVTILGINIVVGLALPFIWHMLKAYQKQRILAFLNPASDPYGAGYHSLQSRIAIGSGGLLGKGFLRGTQTQLQFIPEQHSDFIFSQIGEEFGFIGSALLISLFAIIIWRAFSIADGTRDYFGKLLACGIAAMTAFHLFANTGMALGLLPVVGIPLPFVSYGGSSLLMNLIAIGILQSVSMRREKLIF